MSPKVLFAILFLLFVWWLVHYILWPLWQKKYKKKKHLPSTDSSLFLEDHQYLSEYPIEEFSTLDTPDNSIDKRELGPVYADSDGITTLYRTVPQPNNTNAKNHDANETDHDAEIDGDLYATTNLQGQLAAIRLEKDLTAIRSKNEKSRRDSPSSPIRTEVYSPVDLPDKPTKEDGSPDLQAHIDNLESRLYDSESDVTMLHSELKNARAYEMRYYDSDTRLAENQILLLEKEDVLTDLQSRYDKLDQANDDLLEKNILLRSWLGELESQRNNLVQLPILEEKLAQQEKQLEEHKSVFENTRSIESHLVDKEHEIAQLHVKLHQFDQLDSSLKEKEAELEKLKQQTKQLAQLEKTLQKKNTEIEKLNANTIKTEQYIAQIARQDTEIENLLYIQADNKNLIKQTQSKNNEIKELNKKLFELSGFKANALQREKEIQSLKIQLAENNSENSKNLRELQTQLENLKKNHAELNNQIKEQTDQISELAQVRANANILATKLKEKELEASHLALEFQNLNKAQTELVRKDQQKKKQIEHLEETAKQLEAEKRKVSQLESGVITKENEIAQLKEDYAKQFSNRDTDVKQLKKTRMQNMPDQSVEIKTKPVGQNNLSSQAPQEKDDLKLIRGIGPVIERALNKRGITTFKQISDLTAAEIEEVSIEIKSFPGRIIRDDWIGHAKIENAKKYKR